MSPAGAAIPAPSPRPGASCAYRRRAQPPFAFTVVSTNVRDILGVDVTDLLGSSSFWIQQIHPDDCVRVSAFFERFDLSDRRAQQIDYRFLRSGGDVVWVADRLRRVAGADGEPVLAGIWTDISDAKRAEEAIDLGRRQLEALFSHSLDAILLATDDARHIEANPAACELSGYSREELLTKTVWELAPPGNRTAACQLWNEFLTSGELSGDFALLRSDGTTCDTEMRAVAHVLPGRHLWILRDVTVRKQAERVRQRYLSRLEVLANIDRAVLHAESAQAVADGALRHIAQLVPCARASVGLFEASNATTTLLAVWSSRPTARGPGVTLPLAGVKSLDVLLAGRDVTAVDLAEEPNPSILERGLLAEGLRGFLCVPLRLSDRTIGTLNICSDSPWTCSSEERSVATEIADRLAVAISNARLMEELRTAGERLAATSKHLLELQEIERRDLSRELHDEIGQLLTGLKLGLSDARARADGDTAPRLRDAEALADELIAKVRQLSLNLRPPVLDALGLLSALTLHFERFTAQTRVAVQFTHEGLERRFPVQVETAAYRIVQESLTNVARHARVAAVRIDVRAGDRFVRVTVEDSGVGFDVAATRRHAGTFGLTGMAERVALLGGRLDIESTPGSGTRITADIPAA